MAEQRVPRVGQSSTRPESPRSIVRGLQGGNFWQCSDPRSQRPNPREGIKKGRGIYAVEVPAGEPGSCAEHSNVANRETIGANARPKSTRDAPRR